MQAVGIVVEYNPFHNGHHWHAQRARQLSGCQFVIGVMSGQFVQRGEPALFDKWKRAEMAVSAGVDLVIELPAVFAVRSAQYFATGGIRLLQALGVVSHICFGAEHADLALLKKAAHAIADHQTIQTMRAELETGSTYAAAFGKALEAEGNIESAIFTHPNNILAIQYLDALQNFAPGIIPIAITRQSSHYHDTALTAPFASATAIRQILLEEMTVTGQLAATMPTTTATIINYLLNAKRGPVTLSALSDIILAKLRMSSLEHLEQLPNVSEGLHYKIRECALQAGTVEELLTLLKSKRYTRTRLQRIIIHALLGTTKPSIADFDKSGPLYARILAFNQQGRSLLKHINCRTTLPLITKTTHYLTSKQRDQQQLTPLQKMLTIDTMASDIYALGLPAAHYKAGGWDFKHSPAYLP
ncbi:MAG TPA: nucleotidyltransferase [Negativicutes bacterium]